MFQLKGENTWYEHLFIMNYPVHTKACCVIALQSNLIVLSVMSEPCWIAAFEYLVPSPPPRLPPPPPLPPPHHHLIIIIIVYWNTVAIPISCVSFYSYSECWSNFGVIWGFFGPNGVIFRAWGRFKNCSGVYSYVLTSLISIGFTKPLFQNFLKIFWRQTDRPTDRQTDGQSHP